jgi:hypothetical protein
MHYDRIIQESLKKTALKRIRIKVDPALVNASADLTGLDGYEGYVLEECMGKMKVLVLTPDMHIHDIPEEFIEMLSTQHDADVFEEFRAFAIKNLIQDGMPENSPTLQQVRNSSCLNDIEQYLKQSGFTGERLSDMYRDFITNDN